ncbi:unnamed protein product, partial [Thlaspi arvense]
MAEKAGNTEATNPWVFRSNPMVQRGFKALTLSFFLGILIVWGIDGWSFNSFHKEFVLLKFTNTRNRTQAQFTHRNQGNFSPYIALVHPNLSFHENFTHNPENLTQTQKNSSEILTHNPENLTQTQKNSSQLPNRNPENLTQTQKKSSQIPIIPANVTSFSKSFPTHSSVNLTEPPTLAKASPEWISSELEPNYTSKLLADWLAPGGSPCRDSKTVEISVPKLDGLDRVQLSTGDIHEFVFQALDESGKPRCSGGDYFETDLSGVAWKSRPPVKDWGNGTYSLSLQIHQDFAGDYNLTRFAFDKELRKFPIKFFKSKTLLPEMAACKKSDFRRDVWTGRWTRHGENPSCSIDREGRFRCFAPAYPCKTPWCYGPLGSLESNGWTYSTHCSFKLFSGEEAWKCLNGRWFFFWGDSNHCDTIRNILNFILDLRDIKTVPRIFDMNITNPKNPSQVFRITSIFNGHQNETGNYQGLNSLKDDGYRELLKGYFSGKTVPDTVVMNSGLHDGVFWQNIRRFADGAERAAAFWAEVFEEVRRRGLAAPEVIYRSTVATGGYARRLAFNPSKMEAFNGVLLEKLRRRGVVGWVVDHFDMTYPGITTTAAATESIMAELRRRRGGVTARLATSTSSTSCWATCCSTPYAQVSEEA